MTDAGRLHALEIENARLTEEKRALELANARLAGEVAGLREVLHVMRHLLPSALPGTPTVVVPVSAESAPAHAWMDGGVGRKLAS